MKSRQVSTQARKIFSNISAHKEITNISFAGDVLKALPLNGDANLFQVGDSPRQRVDTMNRTGFHVSQLHEGGTAELRIAESWFSSYWVRCDVGSNRLARERKALRGDKYNDLRIVRPKAASACDCVHLRFREVIRVGAWVIRCWLFRGRADGLKNQHDRFIGWRSGELRKGRFGVFPPRCIAFAVIRAPLGDARTAGGDRCDIQKEA